MKIFHQHPWNISLDEAARIQLTLQSLVNVQVHLATDAVHTIAAADISYSRGSDILFGAVVVLRFPSLEILSVYYATATVSFPYVPGFLSFREIPVLLEIFAAIDHSVDVVLCDGQGIAHPRRFGLASHLGVLLNKPALGCAKSHLVGNYHEPPRQKGGFSEIRYRNALVGYALRTREGVKPVFVSPGHLMTPEDARDLVMACVTKFRLPEPLRYAHQLVNEYRREKEGSASS